MFCHTHLKKSTLMLLCFVVFIHARSVINEEKGSDKKQINKKRTFREGNGVLLPCNVTESPDVKVWWTKNVSRSDFHQDGIVLRFNVVSRLDGGTYLCHAQNVSADANATVVDFVILNVQYPAEAPEFFVTRNRLWENETLTINAVVEGNPDPTYAVFNNDTGRGWLRASLAANFSINVKVRCEDMGNFMVTGYNRLNKKNFTKSEYVTVLCSPKPDMYNTYIVYAAFGGNTSLKMDCAGYPYPKFMWRHGDKDVTYRSNQLSHHSSAIVFESTSLSNFGNYSVTVTNEYGHYTKIYQLVAQGAPGKPTNLKVLKVNEHSVVLGWETGYDYGLPQNVHVMKWIGNESMDITLVYVQPNPTGFQYVQKEVSHLDSKTPYRIVLVSQNIYGLSQVSEDIRFVTKEEPQSQDHSGSYELRIIIPVSILGALCLIAVLFAIVHLRRNTLRKKGSSSSQLEKKYIIN